MADYLATALVRVRPDTKNFTTELRADLKSRIRNIKLTVPVRADLKAFHQQVNRELKAQPIKIPVVPDMTGFQAELRRRVESSARGVKAKIQVEAVGGVASRNLTQKVKAPPPPVVNELGNINRAAITADALGNVAAVESLTAATKAQAVVEKEAAQSAKLLRDQEKAAARGVQDREKAEKSSIRTTRQLESATRSLAISSSSATKEHVLLAALDREEAAANKALSLAIKEGNVARQGEIESTLKANALKRQNVAATVEQNIAQNASAHSDAAALARQRQLQKGALSSSLALGGLRGATLAAGAPFLIAAAAVTAFSKSVQSASGLQTNLNVFAETTGATAEQLKLAGEQAKILGRDITLPAVSATDAASAFTELGKAGLSVEDSLAGARGVLQLATAAQIDNAEATELAASALNSFGLAGNQAVHVADLLTGAANEAQGSISDMGIALQQSSAAARQVGVGLEDTVTILTLLARNGLRGSDAGTSLRTAFLRLIRPTKQASELLDQLNVRIRDSQGDVRPQVFADLGVALEGLTRAQRDATLATIFGQDAFRAAAILAREGVEGFDRVSVAINKEGLAADLAGARTKGFSGQIESLKNNLDTLGTTLGAVAIPLLSGLITQFNDVVAVANQAGDSVTKFTDSLPGAGGGGGRGSQLFGFLKGGPLKQIPELEKQSKALFDTIREGQDISFTKLPTDQLDDLQKKFRTSAASAIKLSAALKSTNLGFASGDLSGQERALSNLKAIEKQIKGSGEHAQELRQQLNGVERLVIALGRAPTPLELEMFFAEGGLNPEKLDKIRKGLIANPFKVPIEVDLDSFTREVDQVGKTIIESVRETLLNSSLPEVAAALGVQVVDTMKKSVLDQGPIDLTIRLTIEQVNKKLAAIDERGILAEIKGSTSEQIDALNKKIAILNRQLNNPNISENDEARRNLQNQLLAAQKDRQAILDSLVADQKQKESDAKAAAEKAKAAAETAHQNTIKAFNLAISVQNNKILIATGTKWLGDDLRTTRELGKIIKAAIKSGKLRTDELASFVQQQIQNEQDVKNILKEQRDRAKEQRDRLLESAELDVDLAATQENKGAEIRARQLVIKRLQEAQKAAGRRSLEYKRLRNKIAEERKAIAELRKEQAKSGNEAKQLFFQFLTTQQGFAANLFGNLLGPAAAAGTVGRPSPPPVPAPGGARAGAGGRPQGVLERAAGTPSPSQAVSAQASISEAQGDRGVSRGQGSTLVHLMRQQLRVLKDIHREQGHSEARTRRVQARNSTETGTD